MKLRLSLAAIFGALTFGAVLAAAGNDGAAIAASAAAAAAKIKSFQGTIVHEYTVDGKPESYTLKFWRAGQDRFRMEAGDFWVIRNGDTVWAKMGGKVTKTSAKQNQNQGGMSPMGRNSFFFLLLAGQADPKQYKSFTIVGTEDLAEGRAAVIKAVPKGIGASEQVWIRLQDYLPLKAIMKSPTQGWSDITATLKDYKIDAAMDDALFVYAGPVGK